MVGVTSCVYQYNFRTPTAHPQECFQAQIAKRKKKSDVLIEKKKRVRRECQLNAQGALGFGPKIGEIVWWVPGTLLWVRHW